MPPDNFLRQSELQAQLSHFVFEKIAERLDQLEAKLVGQTADVVMEFDRGRGAIGGSTAFDDVGVQRPLGKKVRSLDSHRFSGETLDEGVPNEPPLFLRIDHAGKCRQK